VPVPPYRPCAEHDDDVLPVQELSHWGEPKRRGETLVERSSFFEHFYRAGKFSYFDFRLF
jgi:hypothetical protein